MSRPVVFPLGRKALSWVKRGGKPTRGGRLLQLMHGWQSFWFERNLVLQRHLARPQPLEVDPIFILGLWRSGTTYLHELLSACPGMLAPTNWQCMNPSLLRLRAAPHRRMNVNRPMDGITIDALSPQEDEFALLAFGIPSAYLGFFDPRRLPELTRWLDPNAWTGGEQGGWMAAWLEFLSNIASGGRGRLILKSPGHTFRINALLDRFPNATYVWLVRDSAETFHSNRKMWIAMFERYSLWNWDISVLDDFLGQAFNYAAECLSRATRMLPRDRLVVMPFEQMTGDTLNSLECLNRRLLLGSWIKMQPTLTPMIGAKQRYRMDTYDGSKLTDASSKRARQLHLAQLSALSSHGI